MISTKEYEPETGILCRSLPPESSPSTGVHWTTQFGPGRESGEREFRMVRWDQDGEDVFRRLYCPLKESLAVGDALAGREYPLTPEIAKLLRGTPVVDIGAHCGGTAAYWEELLQPSRLLCFEPNPTAFEYLTENVGQRNGRPVRLCRMAVSNSNGTSEFFERDQVFNSGLYMNEFPHKVLNVELMAGDMVLSQIAGEIGLLKIDAEFAEVSILQSMQMGDALERVRVIYVEYHDENKRRIIDTMLRNYSVFYSKGLLGMRQGTVGYIRNDL